MKKPKRPVFYMLFFTGWLMLIILAMQPLTILQFREYIAVLFPDGIIGLEERNLLFVIQALMLIVIIPVYILTFVFSWRYRAQNTKAVYDPDLVDNLYAEVVWWTFPLVLTAIIAVITAYKTYELDPFKSIEPKDKEMTIQVVALQWKWLFIYPEEKIATVNFVQFPTDIPIRFEITADAPMNSFWIPHLGGQIYAMPKMTTLLHLIADTAGDYRGSSANLSGEGFSGMHFITRASSEEDYHQWLEKARGSTNSLSWDNYEQLAAPSKDNPVEYFQLKDDNLFNQIVNKYMYPKE